MDNTYFYKDKPIFGLDVGYSSLKVMQIDYANKRYSVSGYGVATFPSASITDGVITDPETIAKATQSLFANHLVGDINTRRVSVSVPAARTFTRSMVLPHLSRKDIADAVSLEAEQYIPVPISDLYIDFSVIRQTDKETEVLAVAIPKKIVDSYIMLTRLLGLDVVSVESSISAAARLFVEAERSDVPTVLIDFGSVSSDVTIYDNDLVVTGTIMGGGDSFSAIIADQLKVTREEAHIIKTKYGLGLSKKQKDITEGITPMLDQIIKEIRRMIRYYEERTGTKRKIGQVVTMGGGANMPGLSEYLTSSLRLPVRMCDPWHHLDFKGLARPNSVEKSMYVSVAGLALTNPKEIFE